MNARTAKESKKDIICDLSREKERDEWVSDFALDVDIMQKLNDLNTKLQGKGPFAHELYWEVNAFQRKLQLFAKQLNEQNFVHFLVLKTQAVTISQLVALQKVSSDLLISRQWRESLIY